MNPFSAKSRSLVFSLILTLTGGLLPAQSGAGPQIYTAPQVVAGRGLGFEFVTTITLQSTFLFPCQAQIFLHRGAGQGVGVALDVNGQTLANPLLVNIQPLSTVRLRITTSAGQAGLFQGAAEITDVCNSLTITAGFDVISQPAGSAAPAAGATVPNEIFNYNVKDIARLLPNQNGRATVDIDLRGRLDGLANSPGIAFVGDPDRPAPQGTDLCHQVFDPDLQPLTGVVCQPFSGGQQAINLNQIFQTLPDFNNATWEFFLQGPAATGVNRPFADVLVIDVTPPNQFRPAPVDIVNPNCFGTGLCLNNDRFRVEVSASEGSTQTNGMPEPIDDLSGLFFFPQLGNDNFELLINVLNGCRFNNHFWVFAAATTDVEYRLTVTDTISGQSRVYDNPLGQPADAVTDTAAFATCP